ncbi:MAG: 3-deoxy-manno-octulosonate cytidylyltransferase [Myxococcales bacterium]|nr:3-deoxy-manno-octulosonate cytidylyltransferase [Myxococcales bacterium]
MRSGVSPEVVAVIPARLASTRLPGKVLRELHGRSMLAWVYAAVARAARVDAVWVATADGEVAAAAREMGAEVVVTRDDHTTGTDRVADAVAQLAEAGVRPRVVVNVQADEPTLSGDVIDALVGAFDDPGVEIATLATRARDAVEVADPDVVKVVCDGRGDALYFSRAPIPYARDGEMLDVARVHVGVYAFRAGALRRFAAARPSPLEALERLEQLRALHHGWRVRVVQTAWRGVGVDTERDLERARALLGGIP